MKAKRITGLLLALALVVLVIAPALVSASPPDIVRDRVPEAVQERLQLGWERVNPYTTRKFVRKNANFATYEAIIDTAPKTLPDNKTLIDTTWYSLLDDGGQRWFESGANLFTARVLEGRVSVEDLSGRLIVWDSLLMVGDAAFSGGTAEIVNDPLNENYTNNTLRWTYGNYATANGKQAVLLRYLRVIEGMISEMWYLPAKPSSGFLLNTNHSEERGFAGDITWIALWDSKGRSVPIQVNPLGAFYVAKEDFHDLTFPVWIDPTATDNIYSSSSDGDIRAGNAVYNTAWTAASGSALNNAYSIIAIGQYTVLGAFNIHRGFLYFNTSNLTGTTITEGSVRLYGSYDYSTTDFYLTFQSGMPTYPHNPLVLADYNKTYYGTSTGGTLHTSGWLSGQYNLFDLDGTGISWINKSGWTKLAIRSSRDIAGTTPTGDEYIGFYGYEKGAGYRPYLFVSYQEPLVKPTLSARDASLVTGTSAQLNVFLDDDGGEPCSMNFRWGLSTAYGGETPWEEGQVSPKNYPVYLLGAFEKGVLYYFVGQASNIKGTTTGASGTFLTNPDPPHSVTYTQGNAQVDISWAKGTGAIYTTIRRSTIGYPATPTDGTSVYHDTGITTTDVGLVNGTLYYYSMWGYVASGGHTKYSLTRERFTATPAAPTLATVRTDAASGVGATTATLNLALTDLGGYTSANVSFQYGLTVAYGTNTTATELSYLTTDSEPIAGLAAATLYHFRAQVQNPSGWAYGSDLTFTTGSNSAPTMTTEPATDKQLDSAQLNGVVTADGGAPPVTVWFEWGTTPACADGTTPTATGLVSLGRFYHGLSPLSHNTTYYYQAVGQNTEGTNRGAVQAFNTTAPAVPTVQTLAASSVGAYQATLHGQVLTDGGVTVETRFEYGINATYGSNTTWVAGYVAGQAFEALISGLALNMTYYYRAWVRNSSGSNVGGNVTFTTAFSAPTNFMATALSYYSVKLSWTKQGDQTLVRYKQGGYPIDRADGTQAYFGSGSEANLSGLSAGSTYYFKAWSWAAGDIWATSSATAIATTLATTAMGEDEDPPDAMLTIDDMPDSFTDSGNGTRLANFTPIYNMLEGARNSYQMPEDTFYFIASMILTLLTVLIGFVGTVSVQYKSGAVAINIGHSGLIGVAIGGFTLGTCAWLGMVSWFMLLVYGLLAGGIAYLTLRSGG